MANATKNDRQGQESSSFKDHGQQGSSQTAGAQGGQGAASGVAGSVSGVVDTVKDAASSAMNWATDMAGSAREYASTGMGAMGDMGHNLGSHATQYAHEAQQYAGMAYDRAGELGRDFTNMVRRNPIPTVLAAVGVGFLLGRTLRS